MVYPGNPEIQVLAGLVGQLVGQFDGVDPHDPLQFVRDGGVVFARLRIKQLQNILDLGNRLLCQGKILKVLPEFVLSTSVIVLISNKNWIFLQND